MTRREVRESKQVQLSGTGGGSIRFAPVGTSWEVQSISVAVQTRVAEARCRIYRGQIGDPFLLFGTYSGSSGDTANGDPPILLNDGEALWIVWESGDPGSYATAVLSAFGDNVDMSRGGFSAV